MKRVGCRQLIPPWSRVASQREIGSYAWVSFVPHQGQKAISIDDDPPSWDRQPEPALGADDHDIGTIGGVLVDVARPTEMCLESIAAGHRSSS